MPSTFATALLLASAGFAPTLRTPGGASSRVAHSPRMILGLPGTASGPWPFASSQPERLREGDAWIDFQMESLGLTRRRVSGGIVVEAPPAAIWSVLTAYEQLPEVVPNILSNEVTRREDGSVTIDQTSLLSRRLNLITEMSLSVEADAAAKTLILRRISGHGFLEFVGSYTLQPRSNGRTYLEYKVELVPCPIFPLPLVETKIRKEVPRMLTAVRAAARAKARPSLGAVSR